MSATAHPASARNVRVGVSRRASLGAVAVIVVALLALSVLRGSAYLPFVGGAGAQSAITGAVRIKGIGDVVGPIRHAELSVTGTTTTGVRVVRHATTDKHGHFALSVPPGRYAVTVIAPPGTPAKHLAVTAGHSTRIQITDVPFI
jgi:hypothetical protein